MQINWLKFSHLGYLGVAGWLILQAWSACQVCDLVQPSSLLMQVKTDIAALGVCSCVSVFLIETMHCITSVVLFWTKFPTELPGVKLKEKAVMFHLRPHQVVYPCFKVNATKILYFCPLLPLVSPATLSFDCNSFFLGPSKHTYLLHTLSF